MQRSSELVKKNNVNQPHSLFPMHFYFRLRTGSRKKFTFLIRRDFWEGKIIQLRLHIGPNECHIEFKTINRNKDSLYEELIMVSTMHKCGE